MKTRAWLLLGALVLIPLGTFALTEKQKANTAYEWLNGKWARPAAGDLQMALRVKKDNQISGSAIIPNGREREGHPQVTGSVSGDVITLEILFPSAFPKATVKYICKSTEGALECRTPNGYEAALKKLEKDPEPAPRYTCSTKFQHCPTQD
jgi:hypothetical protein